MEIYDIDTTIPTLGEAKIPSPIERGKTDPETETFVSDDEQVLIDLNIKRIQKKFQEGKPLPSFELAGPRRMGAQACRSVSSDGLRSEESL